MSDIRQQALQCRHAAQALAQLDSAGKDAMLRAMARRTPRSGSAPGAVAAG